MTRPAKLLLLFVAMFFVAVFANDALAGDVSGIATSPGGLVDELIAAVKAGSPGLVALLALEGVEQGLLFVAPRWSRLSKLVPYLTAAAAVTAGAAASVATNAGPTTVQAAVVALVVAVVAYYRSPIAREANKTTIPPPRNPQAGFSTHNLMLAWAATLLIACGVASIIAVLFGACGATTRQIGADSKACVVDVAKGLPASIESDVITWLTDTSLSDGDVTAKLEALGKGAAQTGLLGGEQAIVCIVQHAVADLQAKLAGSAGAGSGVSMPEAVGVARGEAYLKSKGVN